MQDFALLWLGTAWHTFEGVAVATNPRKESNLFCCNVQAARNLCFVSASETSGLSVSELRTGLVCSSGIPKMPEFVDSRAS